MYLGAEVGQFVTTIAPASDSFQSNEAPSGEIGKQLRTILGFGRVLDRVIDRIAFSSDASFYSLIRQAIAQPATLEEIKALFRFSRAQKVPLVFRAAGTSLSGQAITNGVLVDIARYWRISEVQNKVTRSWLNAFGRSTG
jgi:D-lactate dehydrogenase